MAAKLGLVLVIACTLYVHAFAESSQSSCTTKIVSQLSTCMSYITGSSSMPTTSCCFGLADVVKTKPQCLCQVIGPNAGSSLGITINQNKALALSGACNVKTPSPSLCNVTNGASTAPSSSPLAGAPASLPPSTNGGLMNSVPSVTALAVIFLVSCVSAAGSLSF